MNVHAYLARIGYEGPLEPTADTLRALHRRHLLTVPFENLDIHRRRRIVLDAERFVEKVVGRKRGGFCYELNGAFATLLQAAGFRVTFISARVSNKQGKLSPEFDHLALRVDLRGSWLADVGFGDSFIEPLRLLSQVEQRDPAGGFRLVRAGERWQLERRQPEGDWRPQYDFSLRRRRLSEFAVRCRYHQTSPRSHFTRDRICSLATPDGRITLSGTRLIVTSGGGKEDTALDSDAAWHSALRDRFGIVLDDPHAEPHKHANSVGARGVLISTIRGGAD
jgi:N-hydroxyarylamine O-acetyltransferase